MRDLPSIETNLVFHYAPHKDAVLPRHQAISALTHIPSHFHVRLRLLGANDSSQYIGRIPHSYTSEDFVSAVVQMSDIRGIPEVAELPVVSPLLMPTGEVGTPVVVTPLPPTAGEPL